jgi:dTDP-glucose 4,6-dehydratase
MDWSHQIVLVTGAGGFIGSHLTERLVALGAHTRALVRYNSTNSWGWLEHSPVKRDIEVIPGDIRDPGSLRQAVRQVDIVFHLAALIAIPYSYHVPLSYLCTNVEGTLHVLQAAMEAGVSRVVYTSTSEVYGTARYVPIDEEHPLQGQSPYAASKIAADKFVEAFHLSFGLPVTIVRPFNTYGPRQSARAVIPTIVAQALSQPAVHLGHLEPTRDFNYVADTVDGFIQVAAYAEAIGQVFNIGSGREIAIGELAHTILALMGRNIPIICKPERTRPKHSEVERLCANNRKAQELIGWRSQHTLEEGLAQSIEWMTKHSEQYRPDIYTL